jgi:hypothetical protein
MPLSEIALRWVAHPTANDGPALWPKWIAIRRSGHICLDPSMGRNASCNDVFINFKKTASSYELQRARQTRDWLH